MSWWIWIGAVLAYAAFRAWYDNWRGPLTRAEIDAFMAKLKGTPSAEHNDPEVLRSFLEKDDGREFVMLNVVKVAPGDAPHPRTGAPTPGAELLRKYTGSFVPALMRRAGHPAVVGRKVGGYVDAWRVPPDPGWSIFGTMRYRSRRDMMILVTDPRFLEMHPFKIAGVAETFSFPTQTMMMLYFGPRVWVAMGIVLVAALAQIAVLSAR